MLPLSLYIHIPWCIRKCPYCDFNSHKSPEALPEEQYVAALLADLKEDWSRFPRQSLSSIFIGGGTPSLFSAKAYDSLFEGIQQLIPFTKDIEITLEANPGTVEQQRFQAYHALGINRLSIGIQSFHTPHLKALGRIHDGIDAKEAIAKARRAGFDNINLDIMHGLPEQSVAQGLSDLKTAIEQEPEHLSWYQLTIEPNTVFYKKQPTLPDEVITGALEEAGLNLLASSGYERYEISAFSQERPSLHNLNYWLFGDYYGIGAGAHGKLTSPDGKKVQRTRKHRQPLDYLSKEKPFIAALEEISPPNLIFEFMLNTSRLEKPIPKTLFTERTGLTFEYLSPKLNEAERKGLISQEENHWQVTALGRRYTNDLQLIFLS